MRKYTSRYLWVFVISLLFVNLSFALDSGISTTGDFTADLGVNNDAYRDNDLSRFTPFQLNNTQSCVYSYSGCSLTGASNGCVKGSFFLPGFFWSPNLCCAGRTAIACNTGVTSVKAPDFSIEGPKPEGVWLLSTERNVPVGLTAKRKEKAVSIIKHDLTEPRCIGEVNNWAGIAGLDGTWARGGIILNPASPLICEDQITYEGEMTPRQGEGSKCHKYDEIIINEHGQSKSFPIVDRIGNVGVCTTPPARIDCKAPDLDLKIEHKGLQLGEEPIGKDTLHANIFRANDGRILLKLDVLDPPEDESCGSSGINWADNIADPTLGIKKNELLELLAEKRLSSGDSDEIVAEIYLKKISILKKLLVKLKTNVELHVWAEISQKINSADSEQKKALFSVEAESVKLVNKKINNSILQNIITELQDSRFINNDDVQNLKNLLESKNLDIMENKYSKNFPADLGNLIAKFGMIAIENLKPYDVDEEIFSDLMLEWNTVIKNSDFTSTIPNWLEVLTDVEVQINNLNKSYKDVKSLLGKDLLTQFGGVHYEPNNEDLKSDLTTILSGSAVVASHINNTLNSVDSLNSILSNILTQVQNYNPNVPACAPVKNKKTGKMEVPNLSICQPFDPASLQNLLLKINNVDSNANGLNSDIDRSVLIFGEPIFKLTYYLGDVLNDSLLTLLNTNLDNATNTLAQENLSLKELETSVVSSLNDMVELDAKIEVLRVKIAQLESGTVAGIDPFLVKVSHVEISRCLDSNCANLEKSQKYRKLDLNPVAENKYEWDINYESFDGENYPIFSQKGLYKVILRIFDKAGNASTEEILFIRIYPSFTDKSETEAGMISTCINDLLGNPRELYANFEDTCIVKFIPKDAYGNVVRKNSLLGLDILGQDIEGSYDVLGELGNNFENGIRISDDILEGTPYIQKEGKTIRRITWHVTEVGEEILNIKSLLPTVRVSETNDGAAGFMATIERPIRLMIHSPKVSKRGEVAVEVSGYQDFYMDVPAKFKPWVSLYLSDNKTGNQNFQEPSAEWRVEADQKFCLYAYATTNNNGKKLPINFNAYMKGYTDDGVILVEDASKRLDDLRTPKNLIYNGIDNWRAEKGGIEGLLGQRICTAVHPEGGQVNLAVAFTSEIKYQLDGRDISFPGGSLGNLSSIIPYICRPGVDLECTVKECIVGVDSECSVCDLWPNLFPPATCVAEKTCEELGTCPDCKDFGTCACETTNTCPWEVVAPDPVPDCKGKTTTECQCEVLNPGSCVVWTYTTAGFDVEGGFLADNSEFLYISSSQLEEDEATHLGDVNVKDIREEITRNIFQLTRGVKFENNFNNIRDLNLSLLKDGEITYIKGGLVRLNSGEVGFIDKNNISIEGTHTIIIEDGNLLIDGDLEYAQKGGVLGVVMKNNSYEKRPQFGNIFVNENVSKFVGVYYSDGSLTTTKRHGKDLNILSDMPSIITENFSRSVISTEVGGVITGDLKKQLILSGTLLTKNTLGGSDLITTKDPWGEVGFNEAVKYDLHHVRNYAPIYDSTIGVAGAHLNKSDCVKLDGISCYENKHSFIVRIDENVKRLIPPGFKSGENISY